MPHADRMIRVILRSINSHLLVSRSEEANVRSRRKCAKLYVNLAITIWEIASIFMRVELILKQETETIRGEYRGTIFFFFFFIIRYHNIISEDLHSWLRNFWREKILSSALNNFNCFNSISKKQLN